MTITIINDCSDENAQGRQLTRFSSLLKHPITFIGVRNDLEAAGNLVDVLDALEDREGFIVVNVAPRSGSQKRGENGSPFGIFRFRNICVVATVEGLNLSLAKKFKHINRVELIDIPSTVEKLISAKYIPQGSLGRILRTQFRSYEVLPYVVQYLWDGCSVPSRTLPVEEIPEVPHVIWWIDNFGNCKTTILPSEVQFKEGVSLVTCFGKIPCFARLEDVPDDTLAWVIGSSGFGESRWLELVLQGGDAAKRLHLSVGSRLW